VDQCSLSQPCVSTGAVGLDVRIFLTVSYMASQFEGGWIWTVPSGRVTLRAGSLGRAFVRDKEGDEEVLVSSSSSLFNLLRGEVHAFEVVVVVDTMVVAGESLSRFLLRIALGVVKLSSISVLGLASSTETSEELSSSSSLMFAPFCPRANAEMVFAACLVERRIRLGDDNDELKILVVS
jgi:hypothetical protein